MKQQAKIILFVMIISMNTIIFAHIGISTISISDAPVKNLPTGWSGETIYKKSYTPSSICVDNNGDLLFLNRGEYEIGNLDDQGNITIYATSGTLLLDVIGFQPNANRLLSINRDISSLYAYEAGAFTKINTFPVDKDVDTQLAFDPDDDSFYGGSGENGTGIWHFDSNGNYISTIVSNIQGCGQIALSKNKNLLYYSEVYTGNIVEFNLTTSESKIIASNLGIPGIGESPAICFDDNNTLYSLHKNGTFNSGLFKYQNGSFVHIMYGKHGGGPIYWSSKFQAILVAASAGGCIVSYDPSKTEPKRLTPIINSPAIVKTRDNLIFIAIEKQIFQITSSGLINFTDVLPTTCYQLTLDIDDNIYAGLVNDTMTILRINRNGTYTPWFTEPIYEQLASLSYDSRFNAIIVFTSDLAANKTTARRIPISDPLTYEPIPPLINGTEIRGTVDNNGTVYIYEKDANVIYRIFDGSNEAEIIFSNVHYEDPFFFLQYCSIENGLIAGWNDGLRMFPLSEGSKFEFAESDTGIDFTSLFETADQELIGTHSSQIYLLKHQSESNIIPGFEFFYFILSFIALVYIVSIKRLKRYKLSK
jgi:hypothetical protein